MRALIDVGLAPGLEREPFKRYLAQGLIRMDGTKMSKSKGNLISPERYFDTVGADALRLFHLFVGPPFDDIDWTDQTDSVIDGCGKFLDRLWRACTEVVPAREGPEALTDEDNGIRRAVHHSIADVSRDVAALVLQHRGGALHGAAEHPAALRPRGRRGARQRSGARRSGALLRLLAPMTPHVTAELWEHLWPGEPTVHLQSWPTYDPQLVRQDTVTMVVQVNGKVRDRVEVDASISEFEAEEKALASDKVRGRAERRQAAAGRRAAAAPGQRGGLTAQSLKLASISANTSGSILYGE